MTNLRDISSLTKGAALAAVALLGFGMTSASATVLETQTFTYAQLASGASIDLFSSNLGSLTSISFSATPSDAYTASVTNNGQSAVSGTFSLNAVYTYTFANSSMTTDLLGGGFFDGFLSGNGIQGSSTTAGMFYNSPSVNINPGQTSTPVSGTFTKGYSATSTNLALWSDAGPITSALLTVAGATPSSAAFTQAGGGTTNTSTNLTANPDLTFTIVYNGTSPDTPPTVPEPASMALLGTGLLGLGAMLRRRRRG